MGDEWDLSCLVSDLRCLLTTKSRSPLLAAKTRTEAARQLLKAQRNAVPRETSEDLVIPWGRSGANTDARRLRRMAQMETLVVR